MAEEKTNVMRLLEQAGVAYTPHGYAHGKEHVDGVTVASILGLDPQRVFKTLVTRGASGGFCVFVLPADGTLDLKKAARAAGEKHVEMIHVNDINKVTGYIRGGCSPIGMKNTILPLWRRRPSCGIPFWCRQGVSVHRWNWQGTTCWKCATVNMPI